MKQTVKLTYFKESGKYYSEGSYDTELQNEYEVYAEVKAKRLNKDLPDLSDSHVSEFDILVEFGEGRMSVPCMCNFIGDNLDEAAKVSTMSELITSEAKRLIGKRIIGIESHEYGAKLTLQGGACIKFAGASYGDNGLTQEIDL